MGTTPGFRGNKNQDVSLKGERQYRCYNPPRKNPKCKEVPEHVHENSDDILFPLEGKGKIFIEGSGEFDLFPGVFIRVPKNIKQRVSVEEDLLVYDVFAPPMT